MPVWVAREAGQPGRHLTRGLVRRALAVLNRRWFGPCRCQELHPCWSRGVPVLVQEAAEVIASMDVEMGELVGFGDRFG